MSSKLEELDKKIEQLKARRQRIAAQQRAAESKARRAEDTRRKILIGAMLLDVMEREPITKQRVMSLLDEYIKRPADRSLFGLDIADVE